MTQKSTNELHPTYRLKTIAVAPLLMPVRSCGHYKVNAQWFQLPKTGTFLELFWFTSGCCQFTFDGVPVYVKKDEVCFFLPGDRHRQQSRQDNTEFYWFTIDGEYVSDIIAAYRLKRLPKYAGDCPRGKFDRLRECLENVEINSQYEASSLAMEILNMSQSACNANAKTNKTISDVLSICQNKFKDPEFDVGVLADMMKIHRSTLDRLFLRYRSQTPKQYLTNYRLQKSIGMLLNTGMRIGEIAGECGFANENYFIKVFRAYQGKTPGEFRREYS